jgi:crossover junction endodeoxyribonuclease RuvC
VTRFAFAITTLKILGIDPGLQTTGFGIIEADGPRLHYIASGTIKTKEADQGDLPGRLKLIFEGVREVVMRYEPAQASVEIVFVNVNPQSTLLLGQARGAAIAGLLSNPNSPSVAEYTALQMKKAVVGHGHAAKAQIRHMVMRLLTLPREPHNDAADALGLAICHAHAGHAMAQMARATDLSRRTSAQIKGGRVY